MAFLWIRPRMTACHQKVFPKQNGGLSGNGGSRKPVKFLERIFFYLVVDLTHDSGVPLESSGLRFSSTRSTNIRPNPWNLPMAPCPVVSPLGEYPMLLFHGPLSPIVAK